jgi:hypothetical protein
VLYCIAKAENSLEVGGVMSLMRISICQSPHGYRDIYWCESSNEPAFLVYAPAAHSADVSSSASCSVCGGQIDPNDVEEADNAGHVFLFHISNGGHNPERCKKLEGSRVISVHPI